ncbi:hypothetical protein C942_00940 [Photobacterium marinum]|uniref:Uncharacterized protein n=1 Tax=Photobacterium marinum TaxID=1056511 RepID=L8JC70_9GAMM|nr:hypothetical protein [Photobacterium marinum]ELR65853.1 hypothetical protein C942_00940 [Photobacterium marinum]
MSKVAIQIKVVDVPEGWMWKELRQIIEDVQASTCEVKTYEFHAHGDSIVFQTKCDDLGVKYQVVHESDD